MTEQSAVIEWINQLDSDLDREYISYKLNRNGEVFYIDLQEAQVTDADLSCLANFNRLEHLNICGNEITDAWLVHIANLKDLKYLDASFNFITNAGLKQLRNLTNLESLILNGLEDDEQLTDIQELSPLTKLKELRLNSSQITDDSVAVLLSFKSLKKLDISWTGITDVGIQVLREGLPDCEIECDSAA